MLHHHFDARGAVVSAMWSGIVRAWMNRCRRNQEATNGATDGPVTCWESDLEIPTSRARTHQFRLGHRDVTALLDPGSAVTLVHPDFVQAQGIPARPLALTCVHGDTQPVSGVRIKMHNDQGVWTMSAGVLKSLRMPLLVGRNCPGLDRLYAAAVRKMHGTQLMAASPPPPVVGSPRPRVTSSQTRNPTNSPQEQPWSVFHDSAEPASDEDNASGDGEGSPEEAACDLVNCSQELTPPQLQQMKELVEQHTDVFSVQPGHTTLIQHHIETAPVVNVHIRLYRVPAT
ncbi:hypothetical protein AAFF_G00194150 [Aldrovandia affinis]|uniref:Peptidase A2 domain-containing protein n=1 Tax=Aldrovandia affinis TaxID=143900 RepID=A0AAD7SZG3_9TELE|nr:hypothetical protein AAFF_G00194150 [Aldrovandia affinis]